MSVEWGCYLDRPVGVLFLMDDTRRNNFKWVVVEEMLSSAVFNVILS